MALFAGIDGGQSSTTVLIGDESGRVIGSALGGPCNHVSDSEAAAKFVTVVRGCVRDACISAGKDPEHVRFESACCGMSGGPADKIELLRQILRTDHLRVCTDGEIALSGAIAGGTGIVVIAGTGSIAFGRDDAGRFMRAGGWGYILGDEGGAFDIARQAIRAAVRFEEGWGSPTALHNALLEATGASDANRLFHLVYTSDWPRSRVARLAALVDRVATEHDSIARAILEQAAQSLASLGGAIRGILFPDSILTRVAYIGGVFRSDIVRDRFKTITELTDGCHCMPPMLGPAAGALLDAYRAAGRNVALLNIPTPESSC